MKLSKIFIACLVVTVWANIYTAQTRFRSGIFLHHSTGGCIWSQDGSTTSVPCQIDLYNTTHLFSDTDRVSLNEQGWPETPWSNEWERWHRIFANEDTIDADIRPILKDNKIIIIKSCFPSSDMEGYGGSSDTVANPTSKTIYNYKWHWRSFIKVMKQHPENFFVVWTNAPKISCETNADAARLSHEFCKWAKDTLAAGLDSEFGDFPKNVYIFDFFHKLADEVTHMLPDSLAQGDSHPNAAATDIAAPLFVKETFDAALNYEHQVVINSYDNNTQLYVPGEFALEQNYPNPFNPTTNIEFRISDFGFVTLKVYDILGKEIATLVNEEKPAGSYSVSFNASNLPSGIYFCQIKAGEFVQTKKMTLLK